MFTPKTLQNLIGYKWVSVFEELTDSIEIDLTSAAFQSQSYLLLRDRFQSRLALPGIEIRDGFIYKQTARATRDAVKKQNSWKL